MQEAEMRKMKGMIRGMVLGDRPWAVAFQSHGSFSKRMSLVTIAFLAMLAIGTVVSAHETGSPHEELLPLWPYHSLLMSTGLVAMLAGMITARYMKGKKWWLKAHKNLGITGALLTVAGFTVAVYMVLSDSGVYFRRRIACIYRDHGSGAGCLHSYYGLHAVSEE